MPERKKRTPNRVSPHPPDSMSSSCENCINLVLWDVRRRVAWASAKARGENVQANLRSRAECLAIYNARIVAKDFVCDNEQNFSGIADNEQPPGTFDDLIDPSHP